MAQEAPWYFPSHPLVLKFPAGLRKGKAELEDKESRISRLRSYKGNHGPRMLRHNRKRGLNKALNSGTPTQALHDAPAPKESVRGSHRLTPECAVTTSGTDRQKQ